MYKEAVYAGGCFWGVEHLMRKLRGVVSVQVGYIGGVKDNPTYEQVCSDTTQHYEAVMVVFDDELISYEDLTKYFFEIHDPEQEDGQGHDIGSQYHSAVFYFDKGQKEVAQGLISQLMGKGYNVCTKLLEVTRFWPAEDYHQDYYNKKEVEPYCHFYTKRF